MNYTTMAWMFVFMAGLFALGLLPQWAKRFYPESPSFQIRLAAPTIFGLLAAACFKGWAMPTLLFIAVAGTTLIIIRRQQI